MTLPIPQSVAHLPWRQMTYKFLNTIIDDLFAFVIKMPLLHRLSVFRDDVVFLIFLYQRWIYRVDKTRVNEFGWAGDDSPPQLKGGHMDRSRQGWEAGRCMESLSMCSCCADAETETEVPGVEGDKSDAAAPVDESTARKRKGKKEAAASTEQQQSQENKGSKKDK